MSSNFAALILFFTGFVMMAFAAASPRSRTDLHIGIFGLFLCLSVVVKAFIVLFFPQ